MLISRKRTYLDALPLLVSGYTLEQGDSSLFVNSVKVMSYRYQTLKEYHCTYPYHSPIFPCFHFPFHDLSPPLPSLPALTLLLHFAFPFSLHSLFVCLLLYPPIPLHCLSLCFPPPSSSFSSSPFTSPSSLSCSYSPPRLPTRVGSLFGKCGSGGSLYTCTHTAAQVESLGRH